jgi:hypothetical protein
MTDFGIYCLQVIICSGDDTMSIKLTINLSIASERLSLGMLITILIIVVIDRILVEKAFVKKTFILV